MSKGEWIGLAVILAFLALFLTALITSILGERVVSVRVLRTDNNGSCLLVENTQGGRQKLRIIPCPQDKADG